MVSTSMPASRPGARPGSWRRRAILVGAALILVPSLLLALYTMAALRFAYSSGERAGYVQKFSRKGWVCKTWEGELAMVNLPGAMPEIFAFTVRDEAIATRLNATMGQRVALTYEQHRGVPTACFGETEYFVTDVKPLAP